jgi:hypothetical protein
VRAGVQALRGEGARAARRRDARDSDPRRESPRPARSDAGFAAAKDLTAIHGVAGQHFSHTFTANAGRRSGTIAAPSTLVPDLAALLDDTPPNASENPAAYDQAYRIENPNALIIPEADCARCHVATAYRLNAEARFGTVPSAQRYTSPAGVTASMEPEIERAMGQRLYVVINFGYLFDGPAISQRTVNESAEVAAFLDKAFPN